MLQLAAVKIDSARLKTGQDAATITSPRYVEWKVAQF
jgi:hypothetical protein